MPLKNDKDNTLTRLYAAHHLKINNAYVLINKITRTFAVGLQFHKPCIENVRNVKTMTFLGLIGSQCNICSHAVCARQNYQWVSSVIVEDATNTPQLTLALWSQNAGSRAS